MDRPVGSWIAAPDGAIIGPNLDDEAMAARYAASRAGDGVSALTFDQGSKSMPDPIDQAQNSELITQNSAPSGAAMEEDDDA